MPTSPESSSSNSDTGRISDFEAGLAAFKQGDYPTAIALLEAALTSSLSPPLAIRAQMGLAIAYEKLGESQRAAALCQTLQQVPNAQVSDWATKMLVALGKRYPELSAFPTPANPVPVRHPSLPDFQSAETTDAMGFVPFDPDVSPPTQTPAATQEGGFRVAAPGITEPSPLPRPDTAASSVSPPPPSGPLP